MPDPRMQFITAHKDIGLIAGFGKLSSSGDMLDATIRKISNSTAQLAQSGAEVKISLIEQGTTFKGLEKKLNEYGIQSTQQTQKQIAEVEALAIAYQKHPAVLKQLQNVHQQLNLSLKEGVNSTKMQTFAMQNFSFIAQDAAQFSMGMSQGIRAIANNLDATLFSMIRLSEASDGWGNAMKAMGKQLMSPLGILVGLNIATSLYQILSQQMQKNKVVAEDYKELLGELVEIQNDSVKITFLAGQASEAYRKALERNVEIIDETIHGSKILQKQRQSEFVGIRERASFAAGILDKLDKEEIETLRIRLNVGKEVIEQLEKEADRRMVLDEGCPEAWASGHGAFEATGSNEAAPTHGYDLARRSAGLGAGVSRKGPVRHSTRVVGSHENATPSSWSRQGRWANYASTRAAGHFVDGWNGFSHSLRLTLGTWPSLVTEKVDYLGLGIRRHLTNTLRRSCYCLHPVYLVG